MTEPTLIFTTAAAALVGLAILAIAGLVGWRGWLELERLRVTHRPAAAEPGQATAGARIELADLRERVRKLEAIAAGVDL